MIYFTIVQSILTYSIVVWEFAYSNALEPLNLVHRAIIRIILRQYYNKGNSTNDLFEKLRILNIKQIYNKRSTTKIYMIKINLHHTI